MAERGDIALVFWDGKSAGSADMVTRMVARLKHVTVVPTKPAPRRQLRRTATGKYRVLCVVCGRSTPATVPPTCVHCGGTKLAE